MPEFTPTAVTRLDLGDSLTIAEVAAVREQLRAALNQGDLALVAGELEQVDTAGVQLLCAAVREARQRGNRLIWEQPTSRLCDAARQLGLQQELGLLETDRG